MRKKINRVRATKKVVPRKHSQGHIKRQIAEMRKAKQNQVKKSQRMAEKELFSGREANAGEKKPGQNLYVTKERLEILENARKKKQSRQRILKSALEETRRHACKNAIKAYQEKPTMENEKIVLNTIEQYSKVNLSDANMLMEYFKEISRTTL